jgi:diguanylate cyclase (GGDEF)-like protein
VLNHKFEELRHAGNLPSPSGVGLAILRLTQNPDHSIEELSRCIQADPALTGRLLRLANSQSRAGVDPAQTVTQAAMRLGIRAVRNVALGFTLLSAHRGGMCAGFDYDRYWSKSLVRAVAASAVAARARSCEPAEAFTCAILSEIGMLALASVHADAYGRVLNETVDRPLVELLEAERRAFQIHHLEISAGLMSEWGLARAVTGAVSLWASQSTADIEESSQQCLAWTLDVGTRIAEILMSDRSHDSPEHVTAWSSLCESAERLSIDAVVLAELCARISREWQEWGEQFRIPTRPNVDFGASLPASVAGEPAGVLCDEGARAAASADPVRDDAGHKSGDPIHVLIVDDDVRLLRLVSFHLERAGYQVSTAEDGKAGLKLAIEQRPDIVVTDWVMPELSGLEMCKSLRRMQSGHRAYVLLLTAREEEEDRIVDAFAAGIDDYVTKPFNARILLARVQAGERLIELQRQVESDKRVRMKQVSDMSLLTRRLRAAGLTDILTELPNRRSAMQRLDQEWVASTNTSRPLSVVMIDIDHFKHINDEYGHAIGDKVLQATAEVLRKKTRRGDIVCRWGGEEFVVINVNSDRAGARKCAERLRASVEANEIFCEGFRGRVTVSLGLAERSPSIFDLEALIKAADNAVYDAKRAGRNTIREGPAEPLSESA